MRRRDCLIDVTNQSLAWGELELPLRETVELGERQICCRVTVVDTVVMAPYTEIVVAGNLE